MSNIRSSLAYSFLNTNAVTALQFISTLIVARLLTPADFGTYAVALVFVGVAQMLREFGVTSYVIQAKELTGEMLRAAFGLMLILAWVMALILIASSASIAEFYQEPAVREIMQVLALNFFVTPLGSITLAVARRDMRFRELAIIGIATTVLSVAVTITLAMQGFGAMSLAWGSVANTFSTFLFTLTLRKPGMSWLPSVRGIGKILKFGGTVMSSGILGHLNNSAPDLLLGRVMGMESVGFFNRATSMNRYFANALGGVIGPVMLPWLSQLNRQGASLKDVHARVTELVTGLAWPVYAGIAVLADPLIHVLFGDQWTASAELVPYICMAALIGATYTASGALFIAKGHPVNNLFMEGVNLPLKVGAILLAAPYGLLAVAMTWPVLALVGASMQQIMLRKEFDIRLRDTPIYLGKSLMVTLVPASLVWTGLRQMQSMPEIVQLLVLGAIGLVSWMILLRLVRHPLFDELAKATARLRNR